MKKYRSVIIATVILGSVIIATALHFMGQPWICTCGYVKLWENNIFSDGCSQHFADWYSLSHAIHGMLIVLLARFFGLSFRLSFAIAALTGVGWEIIEHTDFVLNRFREATIAQGYYGDSVLNAVSDFWFMTFGFLTQWALRLRYIFLVIFLLEIISAYFGHDSLIISTIMVIHPMDWLEAWQRS